jgi:hypothetical protein
MKWFPSSGGEIYTALGLLVELLIPWAGFTQEKLKNIGLGGRWM